MAELLQWHRIRHQLNLPAYAAKTSYWVITIAMILGGGIWAYAYVASGTPLMPFLAINVGATAPLLIAAAFRNVPEVGPQVS